MATNLQVDPFNNSNETNIIIMRYVFGSLCHILLAAKLLRHGGHSFPLGLKLDAYLEGKLPGKFEERTSDPPDYRRE